MFDKFLLLESTVWISLKSITSFVYTTLLNLFSLILLSLRCTLRRRFSLWANYLLIDALYSKYVASDKLLILDQGKLQLAWSIFAENKFDMFTRLSSFLDLQHLYYLVIETDVETYSVRLESRPTKKEVFSRYHNIYRSDQFHESLSVLLEYATNCTEISQLDFQV